MVGKKLAHYEILEPLGAGGMGEVYRARDTKLDRDVAIKVLPEDFATDADRLARFEREAKLLASLKHANIAAIHGLEDEGDHRFIVMELVEGETLAERISRDGRIEVEEALDIARQVAGALEAAHDNGVVHRDLKPANVIVANDGKAKVLDFGLAKARVSEDSDTAESLTHSPTAVDATEIGVLLGTAPYMSPEQAKGNAVDKRTDIWSFGCVLYEMLAGHRPFGGKNVAEIFAALLKEEPDWHALPETTPPPIRSLLERCLRKAPARRLRDIGDARIEIEDVGSAGGGMDPSVAASRAGGRAWSRRSAAWLAVGLVLGAALTGAVRWLGELSMEAPAGPTYFDYELPDGVVMNFGFSPQMVFSPDGRRIVFEGLSTNGERQLYLLDLAVSADAQPLAGTRGARVPFFSPDGQELAFVDSSLMMRRLSLEGGGANEIAPVPNLLDGGAWGADGTIVLGTPTGLLRVSHAGGELEPLTRADEGNPPSSDWWPSFTPDGRFVIFSARSSTGFRPGRLSLADRTWRLIDGVEQGRMARYFGDGYLLWMDGDDLFAARVDVEGAVLRGEPQRVLGGVYSSSLSSMPYFAVSDVGDLMYAPGSASPDLRQLVLIGADGRRSPLSDQPQGFYAPRFSPDGRSVAVFQGIGGPGGDGPGGDIWVYPLDTGIGRPITATGVAGWPRWQLPDGDRITHTNIFSSVSSTSILDPSDTRLHLGASSTMIPAGWTPDGKTLLLEVLDGSGTSDILALTDGETEPVLQTPYLEGFADLSPDGRWLAYTSNETGRLEIWVKPYPGPDRGVPISRAGGMDPRWSSDGKRIFYWEGNEVSVPLDFVADELVVVDLEFNPGPRPSGTTVVLSANVTWYAGAYASYYDVSPVDDRIVLVEETERGGATRLRVILDWFEELKERVPTGGQ